MEEKTKEDKCHALDWKSLATWGKQWVAGYIRKMDMESGSYLQGGGEYSETILSLELHTYFQTEQIGKEQWKADLGGMPVIQLCQKLNLDEFEGFCLCLVLLGELEYNYEKLFVYLNNDWNQRLLSVEWAIKLYTYKMETDVSYLRYFFPESNLLKYVLDISYEKHTSGLRRGLKLKAEVLEWLTGDGGFHNCSYLQWNPSEKEALQACMEKRICRRITTAIQQGKTEKQTVFFYLQGGKAEGLSYASWYGRQEQLPVAVLDYQNMQELLEAEQQETVLEEIFLVDGVLCITNMEKFLKEEKMQLKWQAWIKKITDWLPVVFFFGTQAEPGQLTEEFPLIWLELKPLTGEKKYELWKRLATPFDLNEAVIAAAADRYSFWTEEIEESLKCSMQIRYERGEEAVTTECFLEACQNQLKHNLSAWAQLIKTKFDWDDLILPDNQKQVLSEAINQVKYRKQVHETWGFARKNPYGTGLSILFTGPPGTGKTMAAQVMAGTLKRELYKIQLPAIVSKYIGETEKNLRQIFKEGEKSQAVLFFDEADVLFSKRTEVKDSHDKYSNMEAAYMLQKMEEYEGIVVLATNFSQNIDEAFKRRLKFTLEFYLPDQHHRYILWQKSIPKELPLDSDVDLDFLAERFELSGSNIKNIMINAAFLAASQKKGVGMEHILRALENEYRKSGKYLVKEDWQEYAYLFEGC